MSRPTENFPLSAHLQWLVISFTCRWRYLFDRDQPYYAYLAAMLCCSAHKLYWMYSKLYSRIRIVLRLFIYKFTKEVTTYIWQFWMTVLLGYVYHSIRVYQWFLLSLKIPIMLPVCSMHSVTYYAQNHNQLAIVLRNQ